MYYLSVGLSLLGYWIEPLNFYLFFDILITFSFYSICFRGGLSHLYPTIWYHAFIFKN